MTLHTPLADFAFPSQTQAAGTFSSGPLDVAGGANFAVAFVNVSAAGGTTHTLDVKLQSSNDGSTWADLPGGAITQITGTANSAIASALVNDDYVQAVATVGGTGSPTVTFAVGVLII
jgi:hypothetical protein